MHTPRKRQREESILLRNNRLMEPYDVGIILGYIYTGLGINSRQKKRMQKRWSYSLLLEVEDQSINTLQNAQHALRLMQ